MTGTIRKRRFWTGSSMVVGAAVALTSVDSAMSDDAMDDFPGGTFDKALHKLFANEGGESGIGFTPLERQDDGKWRFSVPALDAAQLEQAVRGNTLGRPSAFAIHLERSGHYEGWQRVWRRADPAECPTEGGANYTHVVNSSGECWLVEDQDIEGSWSIRGDRLCFEPVPVRLADARCNRVTLVLNSVVLWDGDGRMFGKGSELRQGKSTRRAYLD